jgi:serine/threonine protein kinase
MGCFLRLKFGHKRDTKKIDAAAAAASNGTGDLDPKEEKDFDGTNGCARKYSWSEIERLSMNFSQIVGSGGFSTVYLAHLPGSSIGAIKIHCPSDYLNRVFKQELDILLQLQHDNIVKLLGYCDNQGLCLVLLKKIVSDITCLSLNLSSCAKNLSLLCLILRRRCFGI